MLCVSGSGATCKHFSIIRICKCEHKIEFASFSIARVHTAICVIEIFRVIKRNYLDSTDSLPLMGGDCMTKTENN